MFIIINLVCMCQQIFPISCKHDVHTVCPTKVLKVLSGTLYVNALLNQSVPNVSPKLF